jgi:leucyl aminopeptidase
MIDVINGPSIGEAEGSALVVPMLADLTPGPGAEWVIEQLGDWVETHLDAVDFTGKNGSVASLPAGDLPFTQVMFIGLGDEVDAEALRRAGGNIARSTANHETVVTTLHQVDVEGAAEAVALGLMLGSYRFDRYKADPIPMKTTSFVLAGGDDATQSDIGRAAAVARGVRFARDWVNQPAGDKPPARLADAIAHEASTRGIEVTVYDERQIIDERFGGLAAVAQGAFNPARMVVLEHAPEGAEVTLALIGKGIVFDSGGLSIKPASGMETMKTDMAGAATVVGAALAIADLDVPIRLLCITPLTENMTGGAAQRPGDVFTARNGVTVEVLNTDAEGRLVLADGLSLAAEAEPDLMIDVATLTGAAKVALGPLVAAMWANDDDVAALVDGAAHATGEKMWRMPLEEEYASMIDSDVADIKNVGERWGGAITAALFLEKFVSDLPWAHIDIAGPGRVGKAEHYISKGGSGFGVRTLVAVAETMAANGVANSGASD